MTYTIWDWVVRLFHWSVATLFLLNFWLFEAGDDIHEIVGYVLAGLLTVRIGWGFWGSTNARFITFFPTPSRLKSYFINPTTRHPIDGGHNALGAVMVMLLIFLLAVVSFSGWLQETDRY